MRLDRKKGFTYIELLIVVLVFAFVSAVVVIILNPAELLRRGRDSKRLSQLAELNKAINLLQADQPSVNLGVPFTVYVSVPDSDAQPGFSTNCSELGLPSLPGGWTYHCVGPSHLQNIDGEGWLPINFKSFSSGPPFTALPVDPVNTVASGLYYSYIPGSYVVTATMESAKYLNGVAAVDGGYAPERVELGTDLALSGRASGLNGYWKMENSFLDSAAAPQDGYSYGGVFFTAGKIGQGASFDGVNDYVDVSYSSDLNPFPFSVEVWAKPQRTTDGIVMSSRKTYRAIIQGEEARKGGYSIGIANGRWEFSVGTGTSFTVVSGSAVSDAWAYLVGTYDGTAIKFYINGALANSVSNTSFNYNNSELLRFGAMNGPTTSFFNGLVDEMSIVSRALTPQEVAARYSASQ